MRNKHTKNTGLKIATIGRRNNLVNQRPDTSEPGPSSAPLSNLPRNQPASNATLTIPMLPPSVISYTAAGTLTLIDMDELLEARQLLDNIETVVSAAHRYYSALQLGHYGTQPAEGLIPMLATPEQVNPSTISFKLCRLRILFGEEVSKANVPLDIAIAEIKDKQAREEEKARQVLEKLEWIRALFNEDGDCWPLVRMISLRKNASPDPDPSATSSPSLLPQVVSPGASDDDYFEGITDDDIRALCIQD
ncbi:hypothetical protein FS749_001756 [Ceratobasidium sp. UAMH 11750]|nr:hypothetical protein FS749_001756 [Ceratobasidium sp. UAMH 11750]